MSTLARTFSTILVSVALVGCTAETASPPVDLDAEAQAIRDISARWMEAVQAGDIATAVGLFAEGAETIFDGELVEGQEAIRADAETTQSENPDRTISWNTRSVVVAASGDLAVERGHWTEDLDGPGAGPEQQGEYVTIYQKIDGEWRVIVDAATTLDAAE